MAMKLYSETDIENIAEAIREPQGLVGYNLFNIDNLENQTRFIFNEDKTEIRFVNEAFFENGQRIGFLKDLCPELKVGDTFIFNFETNAIRNGTAVSYFYLQGYNQTVIINTAYVCTQEMLDSLIYMYSGTTTNCYYKKIQFLIGNNIATPYEPYCRYKVRDLDSAIDNLADKLTSYIPHTATSGNPLSINSIPLKPKELDIVGDSKQNGTPSPDNPIPINVVKSSNGVINYNMVENLFDSEAWFNSISTSSSYYINRKIKENNKYKFIGNNSTSRIDTGNRYSTTIKPNTDYVFTFDYNSTATPNASISLFISNDYTIDTMKYGSYRIGEINPSSGKAVLNFNSENNTLFYFHGYTNYAEISNTLEIWNIMLIEKDFIKTIPFNIGNTEFCKLPNGVADKLWVNLKTGQYGKIKNINKRIYNGSENWEVWVTSVPDITTFFLGNAISDKKVSSINNSISNYFKVNDEYGIYNYQHFAISVINSNISITLNNTELQTIDSAGIKQWLSTHNTILYYEALNPTTEVLGTLSKENLAKLVMYAGVNNIELSGYDNNGAEPIIEIDYYTQI